MKNDDTGSKSTGAVGHPFPATQCLQSIMKMMSISPGSCTKESKEIPVQSLGSGAIYDNIRDGEDFKEESGAFVLVDGDTKKPFGVQANYP